MREHAHRTGYRRVERPARVLLLTADYPPDVWSGIGSAVESQANALARAGADVHVLVASASRLPAANASGPVLHRLNRSACPVDPRGFDCVHLHSLALAELALEMRRRFAVKLAYTAHSIVQRELADGPARRFWSRVQLAMMRASDTVVFLSESERQYALELAPDLGSSQSLRVIGNGIEPAPVAARRPGDGPVVFAGRFTRNKGLPLLLDVLPRIAAGRPLRFVLAGGHGDDSCSRELARLRAALAGACELPGWLSRVRLRALFAEASLVLAPSMYEPFGMVALEAMAAGAPVLASLAGGLREVVRPGSGGELAQSRDPEEWRARAEAILSDDARWSALHERGPRFAAENFDIRRVAGRLQGEVYGG
jgi:glycogen(starch) synthase